MSNTLAFRRQFLLSSKALQFHENWNDRTLKQGSIHLYLYHHPDLPVTTVRNERFELVLLGYVLDVHHPTRSDSEIMEHLSQLKDFDQILEASSTLNGRYVMILMDDQDVKLFNDATGFREIYYGRPGKEVVCGSTPDIIGTYFNIPKSDQGELFEFTQNKIFQKKGHLLVGSQTLYPGVFHLIPNHYLNFINQEQTRFWPVQKREKPVIKAVIQEMVDMLKGTYAAATHRNTLYQGLTSGWDTRLLLAASKDHLSRIKFYYNRGFKRDQTDKPAIDYYVANEMAEKYELDFASIDLDEINIDEDFENTYYQNNVLARPSLLPVFYELHTRGLDNTITVSGTMGNEIMRIMFPINRVVKNSREILKLLQYDSFPVLERELTLWVDDVKEAVESLNYNMIDLFNWEQFFAHWGAISASEQDIVREELRPFNTRKFLDLYISLPDKYRYRDFPLGHVKMIELMWDELLDFGMDIQLYQLKKTLRKLGLEQASDKMFQRSKKVLKRK